LVSEPGMHQSDYINANNMIYNKTRQNWLDFENPLDR
jgi:hypothetical protein